MPITRDVFHVVFYRSTKVFVVALLKKPNQEKSYVSRRSTAFNNMIKPGPELPPICTSLINCECKKFLLEICAYPKRTDLLFQIIINKIVFVWRPGVTHSI